MRTPPDLHPDDLATRECLRDMLVDARLNFGMSQVDLGHRLGRAGVTITVMEHRLTWKVATVQRWAQALGLRLILTPGGWHINEDLFLLRPANVDAAMAFDRRVYIEAMREARHAAGVTQLQLGQRLGITENGVGEIEKGLNVLLLNAQRYCRAMDRPLSIDLEECPSWQV